MRERRRAAVMALALGPWMARAQPAAPRKVAWVGAGEPKALDSLTQRLQRGLDQLGLRTEVRLFRAEKDDPGALARAAAEAVRWSPELVIAPGPLVAVSVAAATSSIPIVFFAVPDPIGFKLVNSLARPGTNATGAASHASTITLKRMELVRELLPKAKRVTSLFRRRGSANVAYLDGIRAQVRGAGRSAGLQVEEVEVRESGLRATLDELAKRPADALVAFGPYGWEPPGMPEADPPAALVAFERRTRCVVIHDNPYALEHGAVVAMYDIGSQVQVAIEIAGRVLRGASPAELPVQTGTKYALLLNPDAARALGVTIPPAVMLRGETFRPGP